jgi:hypothetical protein
MVYEVATLQALRDALRCKEIWVVGADRWRDPDQDLPVDYPQRRIEHTARCAGPWTRLGSSTSCASRCTTSSKR